MFNMYLMFTSTLVLTSISLQIINFPILCFVFTVDFYCCWICLVTETFHQFLITNQTGSDRQAINQDGRLAVKSLQCQIQPHHHLTYITS